MKRLILTLTLVLFAFSALAEETVLGTTGNEDLWWSMPTKRILTNSTFVGGLQSAGTYTYAADNDCLDMVATTDLTALTACAGGAHQTQRTPKDVTLTRLTMILSTAVTGSSDFSCKARLYLNGVAYEDSEVVLAGNNAAGTVATASFSHRISAGQQWAIQFANADGCSSSGSCVCGVSGGQTILPFVYGVEH